MRGGRVGKGMESLTGVARVGTGMKEMADNFEGRGSGWTLKRIQSGTLRVTIHQYAK